jgi:putative glutamine amidotransferase
MIVASDRRPYHCAVPSNVARDGRPPRIGLTTYREPAKWGVWDEPAELLPATYSAGVRDAGAVPVLLPPGAPDTADVALDAVHALLLAGGADVDPARYGADRHLATGPARPDRDEWELALARAALARDLPVLAVCRGMQVLNVALGGSLTQHLPDAVGTELHCPTVGVHGRHDVRLADGSLLGDVFGGQTVVATYHHQSVDRLGAGLVPAAWAEDGVVEAVELSGRAWVVGVQWHPEALYGAPLFDAFVTACRAQTTARVV